jgi:hypothetical protein
VAHVYFFAPNATARYHADGQDPPPSLQQQQQQHKKHRRRRLAHHGAGAERRSSSSSGGGGPTASPACSLPAWQCHRSLAQLADSLAAAALRTVRLRGSELSRDGDPEQQATAYLCTDAPIYEARLFAMTTTLGCCTSF